MVTLEASLDPEMKASMKALREIIEEKLKDHQMHFAPSDVKKPWHEEKRFAWNLAC